MVKKPNRIAFHTQWRHQRSKGIRSFPGVAPPLSTRSDIADRWPW